MNSSARKRFYFNSYFICSFNALGHIKQSTAWKIQLKDFDLTKTTIHPFDVNTCQLFDWISCVKRNTSGWERERRKQLKGGETSARSIITHPLYAHCTFTSMYVSISDLYPFIKMEKHTLNSWWNCAINQLFSISVELLHSNLFKIWSNFLSILHFEESEPSPGHVQQNQQNHNNIICISVMDFDVCTKQWQ